MIENGKHDFERRPVMHGCKKERSFVTYYNRTETFRLIIVFMSTDI